MTGPERRMLGAKNRALEVVRWLAQDRTKVGVLQDIFECVHFPVSGAERF